MEAQEHGDTTLAAYKTPQSSPSNPVVEGLPEPKKKSFQEVKTKISESGQRSYTKRVIEKQIYSGVDRVRVVEVADPRPMSSDRCGLENSLGKSTEFRESKC